MLIGAAAVEVLFNLSMLLATWQARQTPPRHTRASLPSWWCETDPTRHTRASLNALPNFQLRTLILGFSDDADRQMEALHTTLDSNRYLLEMIFGAAADYQTLSGGFCPGSVSSLSQIVTETCDVPGVCSEVYRTVEYTIDTLIPTARRPQRPMITVRLNNRP